MISKLKKLLLVIVLLFTHNCSDKEVQKTKIIGNSMELQMIASYKEGFKELNSGDTLLAAKKFNEAELIYPQSKWAPKAALMAGYSYYSQDYFGDAIYELNRFIKTYPNDKNFSYAYFLLAMCYYEQIVDEKKDLNSILESKRLFEYVISKYPNTDFAIDSKFKVELINNILASKEMYIGNYYYKKKKWIPAINRFKNILKEYDTTIYVEEAIHRLVEVHYRIGLVTESEKYANMLGYNYKTSEWYKYSYVIFNKNYDDEIKKLKDDKKQKKTLIKKFKVLFD
tara:strand:+ start:171 stop:1019 length:849 start_codon:yes stop_codon:yes gene_type:complete